MAAQLESEPKYVATGNTIGGICVDIMRAVEQSDPSLRFVGDQRWLSLGRIEAGVYSGSLDAACGMVKNATRVNRFQFPSLPIYQVRYHLVVRSHDPIEIHSWEDVRALGQQGIVLVNLGSGPIGRLEAIGGLLLDTAGNTTDTNLRKLEAGRGRFFYYRSPGLKSALAPYSGKFRILPTVMDATPFYFFFGKHVAPEVVHRFSNALGQLEQSGVLTQIVDRWDNE
ncbi:ABC transporter substrate-binding protein [Chitinivorax sp. B]|uniref:substrate-binding periplasmic protein n=1 Tax=Chitinivorax sp. B TaxID=2502235 RepID=UPI001485BB10|nr:ABC transporter substrate-binding protein [Chitinivorax sp. B]